MLTHLNTKLGKRNTNIVSLVELRLKDKYLYMYGICCDSEGANQIMFGKRDANSIL